MSSASAILTTHHANWSAWLHHVGASGVARPTPDEAVRLLLAFVPLNTGLQEYVRRAFDRLGVTLHPDSGMVPRGRGLFSVQTERDLAAEWQAPHVYLGDRSAPRWTFTAAHELGHAVLHSFCQHNAINGDFRSIYSDYARAEGYCNDFANTLLQLEDAERPSASLAMEIERTMTAGARRDSDGVRSATGLNFTLQHLYTLARMRHSSIRRTIGWLHKSEMLTTLETSIGVMRVAVNKKTGEDRSLRLWRLASPAWGFLPTNEYAVKLGFSLAPDAFERVPAMRVWAQPESLAVKENCDLLGISSPTRWRWRVLNANCAYTPVDVEGEGRYLLAIWTWHPDRDLSAPSPPGFSAA